MPQPAARAGDPTALGALILPPCLPLVLIGGMPAARLGDLCGILPPGLPPIVMGPITAGSPTVLIGGQPAARMGDACVGMGPNDTILLGFPAVIIGP